MAALDAAARAGQPISMTELMARAEILSRRTLADKPDELAAVLWLVSPAGSWMTGKVIEIDGGASGSTWPLPGRAAQASASSGSAALRHRAAKAVSAGAGSSDGCGGMAEAVGVAGCSGILRRVVD